MEFGRIYSETGELIKKIVMVGKMNFTKKRGILFIGIVLVVVVLSFLVFRQHQPDTPEKQADSAEKVTEFEGLAVKVPGSEPNSYWELKLTKLTSLGDVGQMTEISGKYFVNQKPLYFLSAGQGQIFWKNRRLAFKDKVELKNEDGKRIVADTLTWDPRRETIEAKGNVTLEADDMTVKTEGLTTSTDFKKVDFSGMTKVITKRGPADG